ncbi:hypothetical protein CYMTET_44572 [Cymbomonas tetramitiformis]|uniref:Uncharacterized protein n=1 Tax=Cymbomonas tetramitiformis TaxID=36881 RepID=A0AAE0BZX7_9CHLO|nr:hypothetical protein CYMTET_44572 [Cymbomonas tetramitiformis]
MGGFHVGGAADGVPPFATVKIDGVHVGTTEPPPPPPLSDDGTDGDADGRVYPAADGVHFDNPRPSRTSWPRDRLRSNMKNFTFKMPG